MSILKTKYKKETEKDHAHTEVYHNDTYLGYFIKNDNKYGAKEENWTFCKKHPSVQYFNAMTKKEVLETLEKQVLKQPVVLRQHFGMSTKLD